ncbi:DUF3833 domain-containing protein [Motilimonas pumila]|uniref:DUF3833 domain-containing protein n=1 Tax=Motilimonas pumila TaxID=2303987 RepID=A0A418YFJ0_9GAMM|nr:DUF3833 domain-containing protein [Motilimonas pumila]RJG48140.1 DUF3833 domain-containing protein [Motilimonas pumila]
MKNWLSIIIVTFLLTACSHQQLEDYAGSSPTMNVKSFFEGELEAKGVVMDRSGQVQRRFVVTMLGTWQGNKGKLEEWFVFDDGEKTTRTWHFEKQGTGVYVGRASDVVGPAQGKQIGFALQWKYELDLEVAGSQYRVEFDDWLYQVDETTVINRSYINKWGLQVGEVILVINKI